MDLSIIVPMLAATALVFVVLPVSVAVYSEYRRRKQVRCPAGNAAAVIRVDGVRAALASLIGRRASVAECSLWPERGGCDHACVRIAGPLVGIPAPARRV